MKYRPPRQVGERDTDRPLAAVTAPPAALRWPWSEEAFAPPPRGRFVRQTRMEVLFGAASLSVVPQINTLYIGPPPAPWRGSATARLLLRQLQPWASCVLREQDGRLADIEFQTELASPSTPRSLDIDAFFSGIFYSAPPFG